MNGKIHNNATIIKGEGGGVRGELTLNAHLPFVGYIRTLFSEKLETAEAEKQLMLCI